MRISESILGEQILPTMNNDELFNTLSETFATYPTEFFGFSVVKCVLDDRIELKVRTKRTTLDFHLWVKDKYIIVSGLYHIGTPTTAITLEKNFCDYILDHLRHLPYKVWWIGRRIFELN